MAEGVGFSLGTRGGEEISKFVSVIAAVAAVAAVAVIAVVYHTKNGAMTTTDNYIDYLVPAFTITLKFNAMIHDMRKVIL